MNKLKSEATPGSHDHDTKAQPTLICPLFTFT